MKLYKLFVFLFSSIIVCLCAYLIYLTAQSSIIASTTALTSGEVTVVIDAGHGGADGGATGSDGTTEAEINLKIAQNLEGVLSSFGISTVMTRTDENSVHSEDAVTIREQKVSDIHNRMKIMNETENCIFVSIHQNSFENTSLWGTQVFYSPNTTSSPELADCIQASVRERLQPDNDRVIKKCGKSVYLLYNAKKTAVLVECGFMTNPDELAKLKTGEYQKQMALAVALGIIEYIN